jgi:predicted permease
VLRRLVSRVRHLLGAARFRRELDEEMAFHLEQLTRDLVRGGLDPAEAHRQARLRFGSTEHVHERARGARGLGALDEWARNTRLAIRRLGRSPLFAGTFVLTLALCIGFGTAVFSVIDAVLWRPLPYPEAERLANVATYDPARGLIPTNTAVDGRAWEQIRDEGAPVERAVYSPAVRGVGLSTEDAAAYVLQQRIGAGYFATLGISPLLGREFTTAEDVPDGPAVAILGHDLWMRTFSGDPSVVGRTIRLKGEPHTVVGIMPDFPSAGLSADVWTPLRASNTGEGMGTNYRVLVRIPAGMSTEEADARIASIEVPRRSEDSPERRFGLVALHDAETSGVRIPMLIALGTFGVMLLVGFANLAVLQIARALGRESEMATRQALGGGTSALVRQTIAENLLLGALGAAVGIAFAGVALTGLEDLVRSRLGIWQDLRIDLRTIGAALGIAGVATVLFSLAPIMQARRESLYRRIVTGARSVGGRGHEARKMLLVGQVAMVAALLIGAGLLVRSYRYLGGLEPGFDPEDVFAVTLSLDDARYADAENVRRLFEESLDAIETIPGVTSAAVALSLPYEQPLNEGFRVQGSDQYSTTNVVYVTPAFFSTLSIPLLRGRTFDERDRADAPAASVANQAFIDTYLAGNWDPGTSISLGGAPVPIVGVVGNVQQPSGWGGDGQPVWETPTIYTAAAQVGSRTFEMVHVWFTPSWIVKGSAGLSTQVRAALRAVDPDLAVARVTPIADLIDDALAWERFAAGFLVAVGAFTLLLAIVGLYGIVGYEVRERRNELGLRMSLGASTGRAVWATSARGIVLAVYGLGLGGVLGVASARTLLAGFLHGVGPFDPTTLVVVFSSLLIVAIAASLVPAARVARIDPAEVLRAG